MTKRKPVGAVIGAAAALLALAAIPSRAHTLGGGGRSTPSTRTSSSSSSKAWNELDPSTDEKKSAAPGKTDPEREAAAERLKTMRAGCESPDPSLRAACLGPIDAAAAAVGAMPPPDRPASAPGGLDEARETEAARLKAARAGCDSLNESERDACFAKMQTDHEKWHEKHEPMFSGRELADLKKLQLARAKCLKLPEAKERRSCLKALVKKKAVVRP